ncbi:MAG: protein with role in RNA processing [Alyxoria varia]|nr:MAG: protein with role in RNA processing [Alyxoria varia]
MAANDVKRQSVGSRVATPKLGSQGPGDFDTALPKAVGARVKLTTASPSLTIEGTVFTVCPVTNLIAINTAKNASSTNGDYHLIPVSRVASFSILSLNARAESTSATPNFADAQPAITPVDSKTLKAREEAAIRKAREQDAKRGKGVGKEGQDIFDALDRTLPCRWADSTIVVNDAVLIAKPYRLDDCSAPKDKQDALARVKKVLENERKKLGDRAGKPGTGVAKKGG